MYSGRMGGQSSAELDVARDVPTLFPSLASILITPFHLALHYMLLPYRAHDDFCFHVIGSAVILRLCCQRSISRFRGFHD